MNLDTNYPLDPNQVVTQGKRWNLGIYVLFYVGTFGLKQKIMVK